MRSSNKNRSRNKNARKSIGNIINRVFDSAGPEGKVRGTPQQIIEKYTMLSRDAATAGDRVMAENFAQHAEHYIRLLAEAQRELGIRQDPSQMSQPVFGAYDDADREDGGLSTIDEDAEAEAGLVLTPESREQPVQGGERQNGFRQNEVRGGDQRSQEGQRGQDGQRNERRERFEQRSERRDFRSDRPPRENRDVRDQNRRERQPAEQARPESRPDARLESLPEPRMEPVPELRPDVPVISGFDPAQLRRPEPVAEPVPQAGPMPVIDTGALEAGPVEMPVTEAPRREPRRPRAERRTEAPAARPVEPTAVPAADAPSSDPQPAAEEAAAAPRSRSRGPRRRRAAGDTPAEAVETDATGVVEAG